MSTRPPFPTAIDSTMLLAWKACPTQFRNSYLLRRKPIGESIHLIAGGAFAAGIERARKAYFDQGLRADDEWLALGIEEVYRQFTIAEEDIPPRYLSKSSHRVAEALVRYFDLWPIATDALRPVIFQGKYGIEFSFALSLPLTNPATGDPLLYAGRCDMLASYGERGYFGVDEKTSGQLGPQWANAFRMRGQFMGYAWAAREHGMPLAGVVVRGIGFLAGETRLEEAIIYTPAYKIDRWYSETLIYAQEMIEAWKQDRYLHNFGSSCGSYGGCPFIDPCDARDDARLLEFDFEHNDWTPIRKIELKVND